jgi:hypothetical protein
VVGEGRVPAQHKRFFTGGKRVVRVEQNGPAGKMQAATELDVARFPSKRVRELALLAEHRAPNHHAMAGNDGHFPHAMEAVEFNVLDAAVDIFGADQARDVTASWPRPTDMPDLPIGVESPLSSL